MKTPKEVLHSRHQSATPALDAIRERVVAGMGVGVAPAPRREFWIVECWRELFWTCRRVWVGLAAVWVAIVLCNSTVVGSREFAGADVKNPPTPREIRTALVEEQKLIRQLLDEMSPAPDAVIQPRPRGDLRRGTRIG